MSRLSGSEQRLDLHQPRRVKHMPPIEQQYAVISASAKMLSSSSMTRAAVVALAGIGARVGGQRFMCHGGSYIGVHPGIFNPCFRVPWSY